MFKAGVRLPRVSATFEFRYDCLKSEFSLIHFVYNLMIRCSKKKKTRSFEKMIWNKK